MKHSGEQGGLVLDTASFTKPRDKRFRFRERDTGLEGVACFANYFGGQIARIAQPNVSRIKIFRTKPGGLAQGRADDAAADVGRACIVLSELLTRKISCGSSQVRIRKRFEIVSEYRGLLQLFRCGGHRIGTFSESLESSSRVYETLGCAFFLPHCLIKILTLSGPLAAFSILSDPSDIF